MLVISNLFLLLVNAVTLRREFTLFNRLAIFILLYSGIIGYDSLYVTYLDNRIGIYNGLFHSTAITPSPQGGRVVPIPPFPPAGSLFIVYLVRGYRGELNYYFKKI